MNSTKDNRAYFTANRAKWAYKLEEGCINCNKPATDLHHVIPIALGGTNKDSNIVPLCAECHGKIHDKDFIKMRRLQREGIALAKERGAYKGRKAVEIDSRFIEEYNRYLAREINKSQLAKILEVSRPTLDKLIKEYTENKEEL